ncbi:MAG: glutaminyl-peptide cyclotransferase [Sandaracinaceae bacterium]|nr:glutaminyl-peptide cyclotransferase [Sandaracinaceae bacterium]
MAKARKKVPKKKAEGARAASEPDEALVAARAVRPAKPAAAAASAAPAPPPRLDPRSWQWIAAFVLGIVLLVGASRFLDHTTDAQAPIDPSAPPPPPPRAAGVEVTADAERLRVRVLRRYPHDTTAFTQGLVWHEGKLFESTGLEGRSSLRRVDPLTGHVERRRDVDPRIFAEGLALVGDRLFQISWQNERALVWNRDTFERITEYHYSGEGWGLCYDGTHLVMSDGTDRLVFRDPAQFRARRSIRVRKNGHPLGRLNELECVDGAVWANIWQSDDIVRIDPRTGDVTAIVDASGLLTPEEQLEGVDVLNGIAYDRASGHFLITGKLWPWLFEVDFVSASADVQPARAIERRPLDPDAPDLRDELEGLDEIDDDEIGVPEAESE